MKSISTVKEVLLQTSIVMIFFLVASCNDRPRQEDTKEIAEERNEEMIDNNKKEKDAQFLVEAAEINLEEIQLGQLAQQKGQSAEVKELGRKMEEAHTKSLNELKALANSKIISIPTSPTNDAQDAYNKLNEKSGKDFDKEFADKMVSGHKDAIDKFEKASRDSTDPDIRNWAMASLPELRNHLAMAEECKQKVDNNKM